MEKDCENIPCWETGCLFEIEWKTGTPTIDLDNLGYSSIFSHGNYNIELSTFGRFKKDKEKFGSHLPAYLVFLWGTDISYYCNSSKAFLECTSLLLKWMNNYIKLKDKCEIE